MKTGVLLLNLGTPDEPTPESVGRYLREFLMDPYVIDLPLPLRWFLVNLVIAPRRSIASAEAYRKIWTDRGSPLKVHTLDLADRVARELGEGYSVRAAMRYRDPSIRSALAGFRDEGVEEIRVFPLYPQYARATSVSSESEVERLARELGLRARLRFAHPFYRDPGFVAAFRERIAESLRGRDFDHVLFSYHGIPERQLRAASPGCGCTQDPELCRTRIHPRNERACYRAHCYETSRLLAEGLGLPRERWSVSFQSRLGRAKWIGPYTDVTLNELASQGVKRLAIACPAFTADCLETLEEIGLRAKEQFLNRGGESLVLVPSLNSEPAWVRAVAGLVKSGRFR